MTKLIFRNVKCSQALLSSLTYRIESLETIENIEWKSQCECDAHHFTKDTDWGRNTQNRCDAETKLISILQISWLIIYLNSAATAAVAVFAVRRHENIQPERTWNVYVRAFACCIHLPTVFRCPFHCRRAADDYHEDGRQRRRWRRRRRRRRPSSDQVKHSNYFLKFPHEKVLARSHWFSDVRPS